MYEIVLQPCGNKNHHSFGGWQKRENIHNDTVSIFACNVNVYKNISFFFLNSSCTFKVDVLQRKMF